jgi:hypothetical protein
MQKYRDSSGKTIGTISRTIYSGLALCYLSISPIYAQSNEGYDTVSDSIDACYENIQTNGATEQGVSDFIQSMSEVFAFTNKDLQEFSECKGTLVDKVDYVYRVYRESLDMDSAVELDGFKLRRYYQLGVTPKEFFHFSDTKRPNLLYIAPHYDPLPVRSFETPDAIAFYNELQEDYDIHVVIAETEREVYHALETIPVIETLVLSGHGSSQSLQLGKYPEATDREEELNPHSYDIEKLDENDYASIDPFFLDIRDGELSEYLSFLSFRSTIFLNSCTTGQGGKEQDNLANAIMDATPSATVISSTRPFSASDIVLLDTYPLDLQIAISYGSVLYGDDVSDVYGNYNTTYSNRPEDSSNTDVKTFYIIPPVDGE